MCSRQIDTYDKENALVSVNIHMLGVSKHTYVWCQWTVKKLAHKYACMLPVTLGSPHSNSDEKFSEQMHVYLKV